MTKRLFKTVATTIFSIGKDLFIIFDQIRIVSIPYIDFDLLAMRIVWKNSNRFE
jgi:hypothetical protein